MQVRDCDFNDSAPCAVVVSKMVQARRSQMAATLAGLPLEDKQKALRAMLELLFRGGAPAEGAPGGAVHAHHAWYPPKVPFKVRAAARAHPARRAENTRTRRIADQLDSIALCSPTRMQSTRNERLSRREFAPYVWSSCPRRTPASWIPL